jgi:hypothetical protein
MYEKFKDFIVAMLTYKKAAGVYGEMERTEKAGNIEKRVDMLVNAASMYERSKKFKVAENMDKKVAAEMTEMGEKKKKQY